jgi:hypothetical protein
VEIYVYGVLLSHRYERKLLAATDENLARQLKAEALKSKNPSEWVQIEADDEEVDGTLSGVATERPKYWLHKGTGYTQWETPPVVQADIEQRLLAQSQNTIYVQSKTPARERYVCPVCV